MAVDYIDSSPHPSFIKMENFAMLSLATQIKAQLIGWCGHHV